MKTILSLVATTGLLIGSAAIGYAHQGSRPTEAAQQGSTPSGEAGLGNNPGGAAQQGSTPTAPAGSADPSGTLHGQLMRERGDRDRNGLIVAPGAGERRVEERDRIRRSRSHGDATIGRGDRDGCATQTYVVPSEKTGDKTSVGVTRC
jgi:hypothetical protein